MKKHGKRTYSVEKSDLGSASSSENTSHYTLKATNFSAGGVEGDYQIPQHIQTGSFAKTRYSDSHPARMDRKSSRFPGGFGDGSARIVASDKK